MNSLRDILTLPRFSDLLLLTKHANLDIPVKNVEISETPDIANFTSSHNFILTTAMVYKDNQSMLKELIDSLININVSGLGIKVGRFIEEIDSDIIDYADKKKFALVQIPETLPLGGVLQQINSFINQSKTEQISYALDIQKQFSNLILNDASFSKIVNEFSNIIKCPIILLDPFKEAVSYSKNLDNLQVSPMELIKNLIKQKAFSHELQSTSKFIDLGNKNQVEIAVYPIKSNNFFPYYLIIVSPENIPYPVSEFAIDQALLVLSFVLLKNDKVLDSKKQIKSDYFLNLIERQEYQLLNDKSWSTYDTNFGIQLSHFYQIIYVTIDHSSTDSLKIKLNEEKMKLAYQWLDKKITSFFPKALIFPEKNSNQLIIMLQNNISQHSLTDSLILLAGQLKQVLPIDLTFACGQSCNSIDQLSTSLVEAKIISDENKKKTNPNSVAFYKPKGILNLFDNMHAEEINYFCRKMLKDLAYPSESMYIELRKTLKTFLNNQCEITKTANDLFIHRNTVKYRIDNCEDILGFTISSPENSLNLRLALELSEQ